MIDRQTMECYSAIKKNKIMSLARKWIKLKIMMLREINQAQKAKDCILSLICGT
jgi:hypothetical protein